MKKIILLGLSLCMGQGIINAAIWRVNNKTSVDADFTTVAAAITAAAAGDTIHIEASTESYGNFTVNKKLVIIGTGYLLNETPANPQTQANTNRSSANQVTFGAGSKSGVIQGLYMNSLTVEDSFITVQRNHITTGISLATTRNVHGDTIRNNYLNHNIAGAHFLCGGLMIYNNIFTGSALFNFNIATINNASGYFVNNSTSYTGSHTINCVNFVMQNNIFRGFLSGYIASNVFFNNFINGVALPATNGNVPNTDFTNIYLETGSSDGKMRLKPTSQAINAGILNGVAVDCGAFGGPAPYTLSGMPPVPSIYELSIPSQVSSGTTVMNVVLSAAAH
jgi:hypothetical protein